MTAYKDKHPIRSYPKDKLQNLVQKHQSLCDILKEIGVPENYAGRRILKETLLKSNINFEHIRSDNKGKKFKGVKKQYTDVDVNNIIAQHFTKNSSTSRNYIITVCKRHNIIPYDKCAECGINPYWNNKPLVFQLDHKNGINNDHRKENLRFICANCHSQCDTYAGRNIKNRDVA